MASIFQQREQPATSLRKQERETPEQIAARTGFGDPAPLQGIQDALGQVPGKQPGAVDVALTPPEAKPAPIQQTLLPQSNDATLPIQPSPLRPQAANDPDQLGQFQQDVDTGRSNIGSQVELADRMRAIREQQQLTPQEAGTAPSKLRRFAGAAAGIGTGVLTMNPLVGLGVNHAITNAPEAERQSRFGQQLNTAKQEESVRQGVTQGEAVQQDWAHEPTARRAINVQEQQLNAPELHFSETPTGAQQVSRFSRRTGAQLGAPEAVPGSGKYEGQLFATPGDFKKAFPELPERIPWQMYNTVADYLKSGANRLQSLDVDFITGDHGMVSYDPTSAKYMRANANGLEDVTAQVAGQHHPPAASIQLQDSNKESVPDWVSKIGAGEVDLTEVPQNIRSQVVTELNNKNIRVVPKDVRLALADVAKARNILKPVRELITKISNESPELRIQDSLMLENYTRSVGTLLSRSLGERGVVTDQDVSRATGLVPGWKAANFAPGWATNEFALLEGVITAQEKVLRENRFETIGRDGKSQPTATRGSHADKSDADLLKIIQGVSQGVK